MSLQEGNELSRKSIFFPELIRLFKTGHLLLLLNLIETLYIRHLLLKFLKLCLPTGYTKVKAIPQLKMSNI